MERDLSMSSLYPGCFVTIVKFKAFLSMYQLKVCF